MERITLFDTTTPGEERRKQITQISRKMEDAVLSLGSEIFSDESKKLWNLYIENNDNS